MDFCRSALPGATGKFARHVEAYATGKPVKFNCRLDLSSGTRFQQKIWRALQTIPRGETRSYAWVTGR